MLTRTLGATAAAVVAIFLVVTPAFADTEYAGVQHSIDWRLVVILVLVALLLFAAALGLADRRD